MRTSSPSSSAAGAVGLAPTEHQPPPPQPLPLRHPPDVRHGATLPGRALRRPLRQLVAETTPGAVVLAEKLAEATVTQVGGRASRGRWPGRRGRGWGRHRRRPWSTRSSPAGRQEGAELAALGRLERTERAPQKGDHGGEQVRRQRAHPAVDDREQLGVVEQHRAAAGEEALDEGGARRPPASRA